MIISMHTPTVAPALPQLFLAAQPDLLTRHWDVYPKEGDSDYTKVNPQNLHPVTFSTLESVAESR